ncbi:MAG: type II secretion system protein GspG [Acidobacteriota bacterium]
MAWTCPCGNANEEGAKFCSRCGAPKSEEEARPDGPAAASSVASPVAPSGPPSAAPPAPKKRFPVGLVAAVAAVVVLLGLCVFGIVAAVAIPNFLAAKNRALQKRAAADIRALSEACEAYAADHGGFPQTGHDADSYYSIVDAEALKPLLEPGYSPSLPVLDPWRHPYSYGVSADGREYVLLCAGSDGQLSLSELPREHIGTQCLEDDMVFENGRFVQEPEGPQKKCK